MPAINWGNLTFTRTSSPEQENLQAAAKAHWQSSFAWGTWGPGEFNNGALAPMNAGSPTTLPTYVPTPADAPAPNTAVTNQLGFTPAPGLPKLRKRR